MSGTKLCQNCGTAPANSGFDYCGRTCGRAAQSRRYQPQGQGYNGGYPPTPYMGPTHQYPQYNYDGRYDEGPAPYRNNSYQQGPSSWASRQYQYPIRPVNTGNNYSYDQWADVGPPRRNGWNKCQHCGMYPKNPPHDYCSRACGQAAQRGPPAPFYPPAVPQPYPGFGPYDPYGQPAYPPPHTWGPPPALCQIPGCTQPGYKGGKYCSNPHREEAVKRSLEHACLFCKKYPKSHPKSHFCGKACKTSAEKAGPLLLEVPTSDPRFEDVSGQFAAAWKHSTNIPAVIRVYKVILPQTVLDQYENYKRKIEAKGKFSKRGMQAGNERRRWHGTTRLCTLGDDPKNLTPCTAQGCSMCAIIRTSYDIQYSTQGWYGKGIYTSATSSKSDGYTNGAASAGSPYKAMFLNRVVVGKAMIYTQIQTGLTGPPAGYDSVIGNLAPPEHDELIVYDNAAVRTSWLLMYDKSQPFTKVTPAAAAAV